MDETDSHNLASLPSIRFEEVTSLAFRFDKETFIAERNRGAFSKSDGDSPKLEPGFGISYSISVFVERISVFCNISSLI